MIRYVLAVVLTVALVGASIAAIERGAVANAERQLERDLEAIDEAATSLVENEELPPPDQRGAQRVVTVSLPDDSLTSRSVEYVEIDRVAENHSVATFAVEGRSERTVHVDQPVVYATPTANRTVELDGSGEEISLVLSLERDESGAPVVVARVADVDV